MEMLLYLIFYVAMVAFGAAFLNNYFKREDDDISKWDDL